MLIMVNDHLIINTDTIGAARFDTKDDRWRLALIGLPEHKVILTDSEMTHIMNEVAVPKMVALLRRTHPLKLIGQPPTTPVPGEDQ